MRVLCIDNSNPADPLRLKPEDQVYEGEIYTVAEETTYRNLLCYLLVEKLLNGYKVMYQASRFIPLMDEEGETKKKKRNKRPARQQMTTRSLTFDFKD